MNIKEKQWASTAKSKVPKWRSVKKKQSIKAFVLLAYGAKYIKSDTN